MSAQEVSQPAQAPQGMISADMGQYLDCLHEITLYLPDDKIRQARLAVHGLYDCLGRLAVLEHVAHIEGPRQEAHGATRANAKDETALSSGERERVKGSWVVSA